MLFLVTSILSICLDSIYSRGTPESYIKSLRAGNCLLLEIQDSPTYISYFFTGTIRVSKYPSNIDVGTGKFIYQYEFSDSGKIERSINKSEVYIFEAIEPSSLSLSLSSFGFFNCSDVLIENSRSISHYFYSNSSKIFNPSSNSTVCYFYGVSWKQTLNLQVGICKDCPDITLFEGRYSQKTMTSGMAYSYIQNVEKFPLTLTISPRNVKSDLSYINLNASTTNFLYPTKYESSTSFKNINSQAVVVIKVYDGDLIATISFIIIYSVLAISIIIICSYRRCKKSSQKLELPTHGMESPFPFTSGKNLQKYMETNDMLVEKK